MSPDEIKNKKIEEPSMEEIEKLSPEEAEVLFSRLQEERRNINVSDLIKKKAELVKKRNQISRIAEISKEKSKETEKSDEPLRKVGQQYSRIIHNKIQEIEITSIKGGITYKIIKDEGGMVSKEGPRPLSEAEFTESLRIYRGRLIKDVVDGVEKNIDLQGELNKEIDAINKEIERVYENAERLNSEFDKKNAEFKKFTGTEEERKKPRSELTKLNNAIRDAERRLSDLRYEKDLLLKEYLNIPDSKISNSEVKEEETSSVNPADAEKSDDLDELKEQYRKNLEMMALLEKELQELLQEEKTEENLVSPSDEKTNSINQAISDSKDNLDDSSAEKETKLANLSAPQENTDTVENKKVSFDANILIRLRQLGGQDSGFLRDVLKMYKEGVTEKMGELKRAIEGKDFVEVRRIAESLYGSSLNVGANGFAETMLKIKSGNDFLMVNVNPAVMAEAEKEAKSTLSIINKAIDIEIERDAELKNIKDVGERLGLDIKYNNKLLRLEIDATGVLQEKEKDEKPEINTQKIENESFERTGKYSFFSVPNKDGSFNMSSERDDFVPSASTFTLEELSNGKFAASIAFYVDAHKLALQYPDKIIYPIFKTNNAFNPNAAHIRTIKPAIYRREGDKMILEKKGEIYFVDILE